jgi:F-type H+-transporting ATPase subunit a
LLAQADTSETHSGAPTEASHAGTGHAEHKPKIGEVPPASLLFWNAGLVALIMVAFAAAAGKKAERIPKGIQNFGEFVAEQLNNFTVGIVGHGGEKYTPLVGTLFLFIFMMNLIGQIPGFHSPTANPSLTLALGVVVFIYVQIQGIKNNGFVNYFKHFCGPMPAMAPLMLPVELISEFVKPFTLAIRLFGNIFGEDVIILVLAGLAGTILGSSFGWLPIQLPLMLLALLTSLVQAMVFAILTCIYLSLMASHEHESDHGGDGHHSAAHAHGR